MYGDYLEECEDDEMNLDFYMSKEDYLLLKKYTVISKINKNEKVITETFVYGNIMNGTTIELREGEVEEDE